MNTDELKQKIQKLENAIKRIDDPDDKDSKELQAAALLRGIAIVQKSDVNVFERAYRRLTANGSEIVPYQTHGCAPLRYTTQSSVHVNSLRRACATILT